MNQLFYSRNGSNYMRDILNCPQETKFTGREILDWAEYQVKNKTPYIEQGLDVLGRFDGINSEKLYQIKHPLNMPMKIGCLIDCGYK